MSNTPTDEQKKEAHLAIVEAIGDALYLFLTDETFTEEEAESFNADVNELAYLAFDVFRPEVISAETTEDGAKKFTIEMTIPEENMFDTFMKHFEWVTGETVDFDSDDEDDE
jgi:hypothetical protein